MDERRRNLRLPASWPGQVWTDGGLLVGRTVDVSDHGLCFVSAPTTALKVGDCYRIEIVGASGASIATVAEVRHISSRGVGLQTRERVLPAGSSSLADRAHLSEGANSSPCVPSLPARRNPSNPVGSGSRPPAARDGVLEYSS